MLTRPMTARLPEWLERELRSFMRDHDLGPSEALRRVAEEWWATTTFPAIEFRESPAGRRAALRGGPEVWEVILVARDYEDDRQGLREHFDWVDPAAIDQALAYYDRFAEAVDRMIQENERLGRLLGEPSG